MLTERLVVACVIAGTILAPMTAGATDSVSGELTAKGQTTPLTHVYAFRKAGWSAGQKPSLHVLLSDKPLPAATIPKDDEGISKMAALVRDGGVHALELRFVGDDTTKLFDAEQGAIYHVAVSPGRLGVSGALKYEAAKGGPKTVSGRISVDPTTAASFGWSCAASFEVALP